MSRNSKKKLDHEPETNITRDARKNSPSISNLELAVHKYNELVYTITIAVLTFGLASKESLILLIPYAIIIPIYYYVQGLAIDTCRISAYLVLFEPDDELSLWEKRVQEYDLLHRKHFLSKSSVMYSFLVILCAVCSIYKCFEQPYILTNRLARILLSIFLMTACLLFIKYKKVNYYEEREKQLKKWQDVLEYEYHSQNFDTTSN